MTYVPTTKPRFLLRQGRTAIPPPRGLFLRSGRLGPACPITIAPVIEPADYLRPYLRATRHGRGGFNGLLWENPRAQALRFEVLAKACRMHRRSILDIGCGRADLLEFLLARGIRPSQYIGVEAVAALARAARRKKRPDCRILEADFTTDASAWVEADVLVFSGSLNTFTSRRFFATLGRAHRVARSEMAFNFLASPCLAGADFLHWHRPHVVRAFAERLGGEVAAFDDYIEGDCTIRVRK